MKFIVLITFFICLLAVNARANSSAPKIDSIKKFVVEVFNNVLRSSTAFLNDLNSAVDVIETDQNKIKDRLVAVGVNNGKQINFIILNGMDKLLRNSATDDGKAVIDCIKAEQGKADNDITKVIDDFGACVLGKTTKILAEVKFILDYLTDLKNDIQDQTNTLSSCTKDESTCLIDFVTTIMNTLRKTLSFDKTGHKEIVDSAIKISNEVTGCVRDVVQKIEPEVQEEFNEVIFCTKKK